MDQKSKHLNEAFISITKSAEEMGAVKDMAQTYLRQKIREDSFFRIILPPQIVSRAETVRSTKHRSVVMIKDIEPDTPAAIPIDFRGSTESQYIVGDRYEIPFMQISSKEMQIKQYELLSYEMPITDVIRQHTEKEIAKAEDQAFMNAVKAALTISGNTVQAQTGGVSLQTGQVLPVTKKHFAELFKKHDAKRLKSAYLLIPLAMYEDIVAWDYSLLGNELVKEVTIGGYSYPTLMGRQIIVTNKDDLVPANVAYAFTSQEYLGHSFLLEEDLVFDMIREYDLFRFKGWELIAAGIGNANAVAKLELPVGTVGGGG